jgi:prepilin-type N-terminal cleavage/methylation domain-containing protein
VGHEVKRGGGYTLIELVLVLTVLGVASLVAAPAVGRAVDGIRVRTEVAGVASLLRWAREEAITRGRTHEVTLDADGRALLVRRVSAETSAPVEKRRTLSSLVQVAAAPSGIFPPITFRPQGGSSGGMLRIEAAGSRVYVVTVDALTGRVATKRVDS